MFIWASRLNSLSLGTRVSFYPKMQMVPRRDFFLLSGRQKEGSECLPCIDHFLTNLLRHIWGGLHWVFKFSYQKLSCTVDKYTANLKTTVQISLRSQFLQNNQDSFYLDQDDGLIFNREKGNILRKQVFKNVLGKHSLRYNLHTVNVLIFV